jgi:hypothetical protein
MLPSAAGTALVFAILGDTGQAWWLIGRFAMFVVGIMASGEWLVCRFRRTS